MNYISGEKLVNFLVEPKKGTKWPSKLPRMKTRQDAITVCKALIKDEFLIRTEKQGKGEMAMSPVRTFDEGAYFTWLYEGDKTLQYLMTGGLIAGIIFCCCQPIWPYFLKVFVWYCTVSFLLFIMGLITVRGFLFLCVWIVGWEFWFLPNLFDESLGFFESFVPVWSLESTKEGQLMYRLGAGGAFFAFCYWAVTQPSEFEGFVKGNEDFLKDLYAGTLLSDMSQSDKESIDKPKHANLDELLRDLDAEIEREENQDFLNLNEDEDNEEKVDSLLDNLVDIEDETTTDEE